MHGLYAEQQFLMDNQTKWDHLTWAKGEIHSQKQSAHWAVDVTAQVVPCWLGSWLNCNLWLVLGQWNQLAFQLIQLDITGVHCHNADDSGDIQLSERKITWVSCIWTPDSSLHLISPFNWILTETWLRWWYTVGWAISSESIDGWRQKWYSFR